MKEGKFTKRGAVLLTAALAIAVLLVVPALYRTSAAASYTPAAESVSAESLSGENVSETESSGGFEDGTVSVSGTTDSSSETQYIDDSSEADAENTDGDDTYVSNTGEVFQIPRVTDSSERVFDYADLFSDSEKASLDSRISSIQDQKNADIIILTSRDVPDDADYGTETTQKYAEQFYLDNGFRDDAIIFIIDMNNRVLWTVGHGKYADEKYVKFEEDVYDAAMREAANVRYYGAADAFLTEVYRLDNTAYRARPTTLSLFISILLTIIVLIVLVMRHKSTQPSKRTTPAVRADNFHLTRHQVIPRGTTVTRRHIPRNNGHSGGGGFSGGVSSGGGFSGGGGSFSGGGGHF